MQISLKSIVTPRAPIAILLVLACVGLWFSPLLGDDIPVMVDLSPVAFYLQSLFSGNVEWLSIVTLLLTFFNAFLLMQLNRSFTLIREKTFILPFSFLLLISVCAQSHIFFVGQIASMVVIFSFFCFLGAYNNRLSVERAFLGSFFISCSALIVPQFLILIIPCWLGLSILNASSFRVYLASFLGLLSPLVLYFGIMYLVHPNLNTTIYSDFFVPFNFKAEEFLLFSSPDRIIHLILLLLILVMSVIGVFSDSLKDATRTRNNLKFVLLISLFSLLITVFYPGILLLIVPIMAVGFSVFFAHATSLRRSNFYSILFIAFCIINLLYSLFQAAKNVL